MSTFVHRYYMSISRYKRTFYQLDVRECQLAAVQILHHILTSLCVCFYTRQMIRNSNRMHDRQCTLSILQLLVLIILFALRTDVMLYKKSHMQYCAYKQINVTCVLICLRKKLEKMMSCNGKTLACIVLHVSKNILLFLQINFHLPLYKSML